MKSLVKIVMLGAVAAAGSTISVLYADPAPAVAPARPTTAPIISIEQMTKESDTLAAQMKDDGRRMQVLKTMAAKQRDVIKVNCVNDKLLVVKAQQNLGEEAYGELRVALARNTDDRQKHFADLQAAASEIKRMRNGADECVGASELYREGDRTIEVSHPVVIDDPTADPGEPFKQTMIEVPAYASPFN